MEFSFENCVRTLSIDVSSVAAMYKRIHEKILWDPNLLNEQV